MPPDDEIAEVPSRHESLRAAASVLEFNHLAIRDEKAPTWRPIGVLRCPWLPRTAGAGINRLLIAGMRRLQSAQNILARTITRINPARAPQFFKSGSVKIHPLALRVGRMRPAAIRAFLPAKAKPAQILHHRLHEFRSRTSWVKVLVAQDQNAAGFFGPLLGRPKSSGMAGVQEACWRGSETAAIDAILHPHL